MAQTNLVAMIRWLNRDAQPHYLLLPRAEYLKKWKPWALPEPTAALLNTAPNR